MTARSPRPRNSSAASTDRRAQPGCRDRPRQKSPGAARRRDRRLAAARTRVTLAALDRAVRTAGARIIAALVARFRDLDIAEEAFADACARAAESWPRSGEPRDPAAWLYRCRTALRALDALRRRRTRERLAPDPADFEPTAEDAMVSDATLIPDERLRLIFVGRRSGRCGRKCGLRSTLRLVCSLSSQRDRPCLSRARGDPGPAPGAGQAQDRRCRCAVRGARAGRLARPAGRGYCPHWKWRTQSRRRCRRGRPARRVCPRNAGPDAGIDAELLPDEPEGTGACRTGSLRRVRGGRRGSTGMA